MNVSKKSYLLGLWFRKHFVELENILTIALHLDHTEGVNFDEIWSHTFNYFGHYNPIS